MNAENINLVVGRRQKNISADVQKVNKQAIQDHVSIQTFINIKTVFIVQKIDFIDTKILSHVNLQLSQNLQLPVGIGELHCSEHLKDMAIC